ncbi:MAG: hypothetical protein KTR31_12505 [Myxococcales bacterium]|nr:hypothetical protein [Myxococcales bacterium]
MWTTVVLSLVGEPRLVERTIVPLDGAHAVLEDGLAFEITAEDDGSRVGWAFVGDGQMSVDVPDGGDALALSAAMGLPEVHAERQLREPFDLLLVVSDDVELNQVADGWPVVKKDRGSLVWTDADGVDQVYVSDLKPNSARATARGALTRRVERLRAVGLDPRVMLAQERMRQGPRRALVEARTERSWLPMIEPAFGSGGDRWLTWLRDPTGMVDDGYRSLVAVHGEGDEDEIRWRVLTGVPHVALVDRAEITRGVANAVLTMVGTGQAVKVETVAKLTVQSPRATELLHLAVPKASTMSRQSGRFPVDDKLEIQGISIGGQPLTRLGVPWGPFEEDPTLDLSSWRLPVALEPGTPVELSLQWRQQWSTSNLLEIGGEPRAQLGRVTAGNALMPQVPGVRQAYPLEIRIGTAAAERWKAAIGSGRLEDVSQGRGRWVMTNVPSDARISFGDFDEQVVPSIGGFPSLRVLRHTPYEGGNPSYVRAVVNFYQRVLGEYPFDEVSVVEGVQRPLVLDTRNLDPGVNADGEALRPEVNAYPGQAVLVALRSAVPRNVGAGILSQHPHAMERGLAHMLVRDWWRDRPWNSRDAWIPEALAALYRDRFVEHAYGADDVAAWRLSDDVIFGALPAKTLVPIMGSRDDRAPEIAARLLGDALRHRMGEPKLLEALHRFHASGASTTDALQAQLEKVGGVSLEGFFDAWFVAGIRPKIQGRWSHGDDEVRLTLVSDVPQAAIEVPVSVRCGKVTRTHWVSIADGRGSARVPCGNGKTDVQLDPEGWLPLRGRELTHDDPRSSTRRRKAGSRRGRAAEPPQGVVN